MPTPFNPARAAMRARGLRLVEGEASAAARARALRRSAASRVQPAFRAIDTKSGRAAIYRGVAPEVEASAAERLAKDAGTRYSPRATAAQQMRAEALRRHAGKPDFDPRSLVEDAPAAGPVATRTTRSGKPMLDAFEERYGWRPRTWDEAEAMLSETDLADLFNETWMGY